MTMSRKRSSTTLAAAAVITATIGGLLWLVGAVGQADTYRIHARFADAGQLIEGAAVRVAGRKVGRVERLELTGGYLVEATLRLDPDIAPLHAGTRAQIRATGQAGLANRYIEVTPGVPSAAALPSGSSLSTAATTGIVDLDALLDTFDRRTRADVRSLIGGGEAMFAGSTSARFNTMLGRLDPAVGAVAATSEEVAADSEALEALVRDAATAASVLAGRGSELERSVQDSAGALSAIARRRQDLATVLRSAPGTLRDARSTLQVLDSTVRRARPTLRLVPAAADSADALLRKATPTLSAARPVLAEARRQLPLAARGITAIKRSAGSTATALDAVGAAARASAPIVRGLRIYGADFVLGVTNGLAGIITSNYNRGGHYGRLNFVENPQTLIAGAGAGLLSKFPLVPGVLNSRTGITALCPGGNQPPAPDGSNRVVVDNTLCDPSQSIPASVNVP